MRIVSYRDQDGDRAGVMTADGVIDAASALGESGGIGVRELLAADRVEDLRDRVAAGAEPLDGEPELLPPVTDPEKIVCIGLNYRSHAAEAGLEPPQAPTIFGKYRNALASPGAEVELPGSSEKVDYEAEVAFVVGRRSKGISEAEALEAIAGYTLLNDLSARDLQFATPQWMPGKVFDGSAPCGPALVTADEVAHDGIEFALELNGERMQDAETSDLIFSIPALLSRLSHLMTLEAGDLVATGTPAGVGGAREPRVWLKPGDEIAIGSPQLGELRTRIAG